MFDPTAFDNMKTLLEGMIYDDDLHGDIEVIKREDVVNLARMNRVFTIGFKLSGKDVEALMKLEMQNSQLYEELLGKTKDPSCNLAVSFHYQDTHLFHIQTKQEWLEQYLEKEVNVIVSYNPLQEERDYDISFLVPMAEGLKEDEMELLEVIYEKMIVALQQF